jgi:hypothetical protein
MVKAKRPWLKRLLLTGMVLILTAAAIYWYIATENFADTKDRQAAFTVIAVDFIREFEKDDKAANKKYADKIITVNGVVSEIEVVDTTVNIKFIDTTSGAYAIFDFQDQHAAEAKTVRVGDSVSIKGSCSGGALSEILGVEFITFKRCTLNK